MFERLKSHSVTAAESPGIADCVDNMAAKMTEQIDTLGDKIVALHDDVNERIGKANVEIQRIIRSNAGKWLSDYKKLKGVSVDLGILPLIEADEQEQSERLTLIDIIVERSAANSVILLCGEGGIGKSYLLFDLCEKLLSDERFIPLYVPMKDVLRTEDSPILQYVYDRYFAELHWERDPNPLKSSVRDFLNSGAARLVFVLDGVNEYTINATERENIVLSEEIRWIQGNRNALALVSSRGRKGYEDAVVVRVKPLDEERVRAFLKEHDNTSAIDLNAANENLIRLLQLPLLLSLFAKTYSSKMSGIGEADIQSVTKHSDILRLCVEYHKYSLSRTSSVNYALDVLLPLVSMRTNTQMNIDEKELVETAYAELKRTLSDDFKRLWLKRDIYKRNEIAKFGDDEYALFESLIGGTILDNAVFLTENEEKVSWQHELLMDWFVARGIVLNLAYDRAESEREVERLLLDVNKSDTKGDGLLPVALFLYEMLEDAPESNSFIYLRLLSTISRSYHYSRDNENINKFAALVIDKIERGDGSDSKEWQRARLINDNAYMMLSVPESEMREDYSYDRCSELLRNALSVMESAIAENDDETEKIRMGISHIYGNLGAYHLRKMETTGDVSHVHQAIAYHEKGLETRSKLFEAFPGNDNDRHLGSSYNSLASDYYKLGDYGRSVEYHRKAIACRERVEEQDIRRVESYTRCISTMNKAKSVSYLGEIIELLRKTLNYTGCLIRNKVELRNLKNGCAETIAFINERGGNTTEMADIREIAVRVDTICAELSIESDLLAQIRQAE
jgi:tetratricopeptide (TPR) repeat protein